MFGEHVFLISSEIEISYKLKNRLTTCISSSLSDDLLFKKWYHLILPTFVPDFVQPSLSQKLCWWFHFHRWDKLSSQPSSILCRKVFSLSIHRKPVWLEALCQKESEKTVDTFPEIIYGRQQNLYWLPIWQHLFP